MINELKFLKLMVADLKSHINILERRIEKLKRTEEPDWTGYDN